MKLNYNLGESDYLDFQLYYVAHSEKTKKQQARTRWSLVITCAVFCIVSFISQKEIYGFYFLISTVVCYFFFPKYAAWLYKRTLRKHVAQIYKDNKTVFSTLNIENKELEYTRREKTSVYPVSKIEKIIELKDYFYLKISDLEYIVIPKSQLEEIDEVKLFLTNLGLDNQLAYSDETNWAWGKH